MGAAETMQRANSFSPFASAFSGAASNPQVQQALKGLFGGGSGQFIADPNALAFGSSYWD